jgi:anaerobic selenocysteine-containing dehydrogenase
MRLPKDYAPLAEGGFTTPSGKCELYSESMARAGLDPVPAYIPPNESRESNPALAARFPLNLLSTPAHHFLNSSFANVLQRHVGEPRLAIHPEDAAARGVADGTMLRVFNDRGSFQARATITTDVRQGVVHAPSIWWSRDMPDGHGVNATTPEVDADLGGAPTFYDNLVEVERLADERDDSRAD